MKLPATVREFLETRAGLLTAWRRFADEPVPRRQAWLFTLGSAALLTFLVQLVTGILLATAYAPTPDHAHESIRALVGLPGGGLVRGLHHWGSSAMVVLVGLHLFRTFFFGAYRKPRELTWLLGVGLFVLVLGFGFTGYLLPWDQKAYWATVVGTKAPATMPIAGPASARLMVGGDSVGAYTLTRFFTLHVVVLPLLMLGLIGGHLALLRRHGHAGPASGPDPREPFFPYQAARDAAVGLLVVAALLLLAWRSPAPLEAPADPSDTSYVPRPEWYFLPLFQLLKYFKGPLEPLGTAVIPGLVVLALALVPWLDRSPDRRLRNRLLVVGGGALVAVAALVLLWLGAQDKPKRPPVDALAPGAGPPPDPYVLAGAKAYADRACARCHGPEGKGGPAEGFALVGRPLSTKEDAFFDHVRKETPPAPTPSEEGEHDPDKDLPWLLAWVRDVGEDGHDLSAVAPGVKAGGVLIAQEDCRQCHRIFGEGGRRGPDLAHVAGKRDRVWLVEHFRDPKKLVPGSKMPSYKYLSAAELDAMTDYLLALP